MKACDQCGKPITGAARNAKRCGPPRECWLIKKREHARVQYRRAKRRPTGNDSAAAIHEHPTSIREAILRALAEEN